MWEILPINKPQLTLDHSQGVFNLKFPRLQPRPATITRHPRPAPNKLSRFATNYHYLIIHFSLKVERIILFELGSERVNI